MYLYLDLHWYLYFELHWYLYFGFPLVPIVWLGAGGMQARPGAAAKGPAAQGQTIQGRKVGGGVRARAHVEGKGVGFA